MRSVRSAAVSGPSAPTNPGVEQRDRDRPQEPRLVVLDPADEGVRELGVDEPDVDQRHRHAIAHARTSIAGHVLERLDELLARLRVGHRARAGAGHAEDGEDLVDVPVGRRFLVDGVHGREQRVDRRPPARGLDRERRHEPVVDPRARQPRRAPQPVVEGRTPRGREGRVEGGAQRGVTEAGRCSGHRVVVASSRREPRALDLRPLSRPRRHGPRPHPARGADPLLRRHDGPRGPPPGHGRRPPRGQPRHDGPRRLRARRAGR